MKNELKLLCIIFGLLIAFTSCNKDKKSSLSTDDEYEVIEIYEYDEVYEPEPRTITEPVQVWKQCWSCLGSGQCSPCFGQGVVYYYNGPQDCPVCTGGRCNVCAGQGGHYETEYQTRTVYN